MRRQLEPMACGLRPGRYPTIRRVFIPRAAAIDQAHGTTLTLAPAASATRGGPLIDAAQGRAGLAAAESDEAYEKDG
jgi:hypothetical protein